ncbi:hypothetical protein U1Q18_029576 [Sarracenia purpurea var. burkii]
MSSRRKISIDAVKASVSFWKFFDNRHVSFLHLIESLNITRYWAEGRVNERRGRTYRRGGGGLRAKTLNRTRSGPSRGFAEAAAVF